MSDKNFFKSEDIAQILSKSVEKYLGNGSVEDSDKDDKEIGSIKKSVEKIGANVTALTDFIAKNVKVEKPKTTEELLADFESRMDEKLKKIGKSDEDDEEDKDEKKDKKGDEKISDMKKSDIMEMVKKAVGDVLSDKVMKKDKVKGKKKNGEVIDEVMSAIAKSAGLDYDADEDEEDDEEDDLDKSGDDSDKDDVKEFTCEDKDENGNILSKEARESRQKLDDFIGSKLEYKYASMGKTREDD